MYKKAKIIFFLVVLIMCQSAPLYSDYSDFYHDLSTAFSLFGDDDSGTSIFPVLDIPLGGRYEAMGGAFTAVSDDITGLESNPAGTSLIPHGELAIFHRNWIADSAVSSLAYASRYGNMGFGVYSKILYLPFDQYDSFGESINKGSYSEALASANFSYNFLPTIPQGGLSLGVSTKLGYRLLPSFIDMNQQVAALLFDVGFLARLNFLKIYQAEMPNFSLGLTLKNIGLSSNEESLPTILSTGLAYRFFLPFLVSVDWNLPLSLDPFAFQINRWSLNLGMELQVVNFLSFQTGFKLQENPVFNFGMELDFDKAKINANYNLDLSGSLNPLDKFSLEVSFNLDSINQENTQTKPLSTRPSALIAENENPEDEVLLENKDEVAKLDDIDQMEEGEEVEVDEIRFVIGSDELKEGAEMIIEKIADEMRDADAVWFSISAYAEFSGNPSKDGKLYRERAKKIRKVLVDNDVDEDQLKISPNGQITMDPDKDQGLIVIRAIPVERLNSKAPTEDIDELFEAGALNKDQNSVVIDDSLFIRFSQSGAGDEFKFKGILFDGDTDIILPKSYQILNKIAETLQNRSTMVILISGYSEWSNNILEEYARYTARAFSIKRYLVSQGIDANQLKISSTGELYSPEEGNLPNIMVKVLEVNGMGELE